MQGPGGEKQSLILLEAPVVARFGGMGFSIQEKNP